MAYEGVVAVGLLTRKDLNVLGPSFTRLWPIDHSSSFDALLKAIDNAERELERGNPRPQ